MPEPLTRKQNYYSDQVGFPVVSNAARQTSASTAERKPGMKKVTPFLSLPWLLGDKDRKKANSVMAAMLQMDKIDISVLQKAYDVA